MVDFDNPLDKEFLADIAKAKRDVWGDDLARPRQFVIGRLNTDGSVSTVVTSGEYGRVWVREPGADTGDAIQAINTVLQQHEISFNRPVQVKKQRGDLIIIGNAPESANYQANFNPRPQTTINRQQYQIALIHPTTPPSMTVKYYGAMYRRKCCTYFISDQISSDFTASIPGANAIAIKVELDPITNTYYETVASSAFVTSKTLLEALSEGLLDVEASAGRFMIGWIKLYNGQTAIGLNDVLSSENMLNLGDTFSNFWNGTILESFDAVATSDGATVTMNIALSVVEDTTDLTMVFSDGMFMLAPSSITLTPGSSSSPQGNWIYIPRTTKVLTKSTSGWPSAEHIKIGFFYIQSASDVQTYGALVNQNWNDHTQTEAGVGAKQGHLSHITERIRTQSALYFSGIDGNGSDDYTTSAAGSVTVQWTSGIVYQLHRHIVTAVDTSGTDDIYVVNANAVDGGSYYRTQNLYDITVDTTGTTLTNKFFNVVLWGVANKTGQYNPVMVNIPTGSYNVLADAQNDVSGYDVFDIPREFNLDSSTGFLICRLTFRKLGGTWVYQSTVDLRGQTPLTATGGAGAAISDFADNQFSVFNVADNTKILELDVSGLTTGTTRTLTIPDQDGTIALVGSTDIKALRYNWFTM